MSSRVKVSWTWSIRFLNQIPEIQFYPLDVNTVPLIAITVHLEIKRRQTYSIDKFFVYVIYNLKRILRYKSEMQMYL